MLSRLHIRNFAVLDEIELEFNAGFCVLTGETGAGKSMLVDALALALGERADSSTVRSGAERTEVTAIFDVAGRAAISAWLAAQDLDTGAECQLRRIVTTEGRSRGYVNGQLVPLETLRTLGALLVEICGQHAHQSLLRPAMQRALLDAHAGNDQILKQVAAAHAAWRAHREEMAALKTAEQDRRSRQSLVEYQVQELLALNLQSGEVEALEQERLLLANFGRISNGLGRVLEQIYDAEGSSAHDLLGSALHQLESLLAIERELASPVEALQAAIINTAEAAEVLRRRLAGLEYDPARQETVESRLAAALDLARKHHCEPAELPAHLARLMQELEGLSTLDSKLQQLQDDLDRLRADLVGACHRLSAARARAAATLAQRTTDNLHQLGMPDATFQVRVTRLPDEQIGVHGADQVDFLVSTNAGQPAGPVARVASGGELSRLSLAIEVLTMSASGVPTLIFDEVDAGIGGGVAEIVGRSLRKLSSTRQVLCVTHLPQVASQADHHYFVSKATKRGQARASVQELSADQRVEEIARMLGGVRITDRTRAHAREMLQAKRDRKAS